MSTNGPLLESASGETADTGDAGEGADDAAANLAQRIARRVQAQRQARANQSPSFSVGTVGATSDPALAPGESTTTAESGDVLGTDTLGAQRLPTTREQTPRASSSRSLSAGLVGRNPAFASDEVGGTESVVDEVGEFFTSDQSLSETAGDVGNAVDERADEIGKDLIKAGRNLAKESPLTAGNPDDELQQAIGDAARGLATLPGRTVRDLPETVGFITGAARDAAQFNSEIVFGDPLSDPSKATQRNQQRGQRVVKGISQTVSKVQNDPSQAGGVIAEFGAGLLTGSVTGSVARKAAGSGRPAGFDAVDRVTPDAESSVGDAASRSVRDPARTVKAGIKSEANAVQRFLGNTRGQADLTDRSSADPDEAATISGDDIPARPFRPVPERGRGGATPGDADPADTPPVDKPTPDTVRRQQERVDTSGETRVPPRAQRRRERAADTDSPDEETAATTRSGGLESLGGFGGGLATTSDSESAVSRQTRVLDDLDSGVTTEGGNVLFRQSLPDELTRTAVETLGQQSGDGTDTQPPGTDGITNTGDSTGDDGGTPPVGTAGGTERVLDDLDDSGATTGDGQTERVRTNADSQQNTLAELFDEGTESAQAANQFGFGRGRVEAGQRGRSQTDTDARVNTDTDARTRVDTRSDVAQDVRPATDVDVDSDVETDTQRRQRQRTRTDLNSNSSQSSDRNRDKDPEQEDDEQTFVESLLASATFSSGIESADELLNEITS